MVLKREGDTEWIPRGNTEWVQRPDFKARDEAKKEAEALKDARGSYVRAASKAMRVSKEQAHLLKERIKKNAEVFAEESVNELDDIGATGVELLEKTPEALNDIGDFGVAAAKEVVSELKGMGEQATNAVKETDAYKSAERTVKTSRAYKWYRRPALKRTSTTEKTSSAPIGRIGNREPGTFGKAYGWVRENVFKQIPLLSDLFSTEKKKAD